MSEQPTPVQPDKIKPTQADIDAALAEYAKGGDQVKTLIKYPFLVPILNNPKPK